MKAAIVCGDRHGRFSDWLHPIRFVLNDFRFDEPCLIIHGACHGVDLIADWIAKIDPENFSRSPFPISRREWWELGRKAGPIRNDRMATVLEAYQSSGFDVSVFGFHPDLEKSRGTRNMLAIAKKKGLPYALYSQPGDALELKPAGVRAGGTALEDCDDAGGDRGEE